MDNSAETLTHTRGCQVWLHLNNDSKLHRSVCFSPFSTQLWNCFWWLGSSRIASVLRPHQKIHTNQFLPPCFTGKRARSNTTIKNTHQNGSQHSNGRLVSGACMTMNKRRLFSDFSISLWRIGRLCELTVMFSSLLRQLWDFSAHAEGEKWW